jgi:hypothetical protein
MIDNDLSVKRMNLNNYEPFINNIKRRFSSFIIIFAFPQNSYKILCLALLGFFYVYVTAAILFLS